MKLLALKRILDKVVKVTVKENEQQIKCNFNCKNPDTKIYTGRESEGEELTVEEVIYFVF